MSLAEEHQRMLEHYRAEVAALDALPPLADVAGVVTGVLLEAWATLSTDQREALAGVVATLERYAGGNTVYAMLKEAQEARAMQRAGAELARISGRAGSSPDAP